ncbi:hypothetical protein P153DRAFT_361005 [Dothidotthia symphoricarpi CBS 119687]|uniref:Aminoglycoside phosphotransferase domain-containing protein n=1 Tax=Dothidotthia symphoricarpi CBS 119687 TaxID=1392245 RepID=A0A6A5ZZ40_9PLEO|nr:uncharacterized protein P153DRAFT_361005 [Dothidotthia symphoricarpi CBS 119687]KAF2124840.1 hypothetical protein P153DRAFT_361005 [Dothidotthia symphoricarpi CBS 119687]
MFFPRVFLLSAVLGFAVAQSSSTISTPSASELLASSTASGSSTSSSTTASASGASQSGQVATHVVEVGGVNGSLIFSPSNVKAQAGDLVQFQFYARVQHHHIPHSYPLANDDEIQNHSVVQSTFDQPCIPMENSVPTKKDAFYSGFMPTNVTVGATSNILTYTIRVQDEKPVWFYCSQGKHCQEGMVGAINAPTSGNKTVEAFAALAANAVKNISPGQGSGSGNETQTGTGSSSTSAGSGTAAETSGSAAATSTGVEIPQSNDASGLESKMLATSRSSFWERMGLEEKDMDVCMRVVREKYGKRRVEEFTEQGYCSVTLVVYPQDEASDGNDLRHDVSAAHGKDGCRIVQFRSGQQALDPSITQAARLTYPTFAPDIRMLNLPLPGQLRIYEMDLLYGTPLSHLQSSEWTLAITTYAKQERLVTSFADMIAQGWQATKKPVSYFRQTRADSPMDEEIDVLSQCTGKVGASIVPRLEGLSEELPDAWLRQRAKSVLEHVRNMSNYPVVLNHGDLIPSNILVDEQTWRISGLCDWAEAEYLPFGTCLYGLEHLLGHLSPTCPSSTRPPNDSSEIVNATTTFVYLDNAPRLRTIFWTQLLGLIEGLVDRQDEVMVVRDMGVLLWYGYAWDDGAINRVVNEVDDKKEIACLRTFLREA